MFPERKNCPDCAAPLGKGASKCRCGWKAGNAPVEEKRIACCYADCLEGAVCRVWTRTGWANVCRTHYPLLVEAPRKTVNYHTEELREIYHNSRHYLNLHPEHKRTLDRVREGDEIDAVEVDKALLESGDGPAPRTHDEYSAVMEELENLVAEKANP